VVDAAIGEVITHVHGMLYELARRRFDEDALDAIVQDARLYLWRTALPSFDRTRGASVTTFCWHALRNFYRRQAAWRSSTSHKARTPDELPACGFVARDEFLAGPIERLAERIMAAPGEFFSTRQATALNVWRDVRPGETVGHAAVRLGADPHAVYVGIGRVRRALAEGDAEDFALFPERYRRAA